MKSQFLIASASSNSGKTTTTLALLRLLRNRGLSVQPFKCGPDYIDTKHHAFASGQQSINLDTFMMSEQHVKTLYAKYSQEAMVSITEGVMGLFDGADRMKGSSAEIAILLGLPVILVMNAKAMAYTAAPILYGFKQFNKQLNIAGVIFNFVNTAAHYQFLKDACEDVGIPALGYIPMNEAIRIPSRHLGLSFSSDQDDALIESAAEHIGKTVDIERLLQATSCEKMDTGHVHEIKTTVKRKISVAKDEAFNFIYHENIERLKTMGEVTFFSPLHDQQLPETDLLYLSGGYPELFLDQLSSNVQMQQAIREFCQKGGAVIAECGGMMYLGSSILDKEGKAYPMVGYLELQTSMQQAKLSLGYRTVELKEEVFYGHEFHYSVCEEHAHIPRIGKIWNARGKEVDTAIYQKNQVFASYIHFYWGEQTGFFTTLFPDLFKADTNNLQNNFSFTTSKKLM
jgi:cobyrinic acid a,c-diamide synthase